MINPNLLFSILLCFSLLTSPGQNIKEVELTLVSQFGGMDVEASAQLNRPSDFIITDKNEIVVCDADDNNIVIFSENGKLIKRFGRAGQGPGEFSRPKKVGILSDELIVFESNNCRIQVLTMSGECIKTYIAPPITSLASSGQIWFAKDGSYYFNTEAYNSDNLIVHRSLDGVELGRYGRIFGEKSNIIKFETKLIKKGKVPDTLKNKVFPAASPDVSVYCIHCALPVVKKFSPEGKLIWEKNLELPEFKRIKSDWIRTNKEAPPNVSFGLSYWRDVELSDKGELFLLINSADRMVLYRMDQDGKILARYTGVEDNIHMISLQGKDLWTFSKTSHEFYHFILRGILS